MKIVLFSGSMRKGQYTEHVATFVKAQLEQRGHEVSLLDPRQLNLSWDDEGEQARPPGLEEIVTAADAFVAVAPEYNHAFSGSLKYMLDLNFAGYKHKPIGFVGVSDGPFGGVRAIEALISVARTTRMVTIRDDVAVSMVKEEIKDGTFVDPEKWAKRLDRMFTELEWMAKVLKHGREQES